MPIPLMFGGLEGEEDNPEDEDEDEEEPEEENEPVSVSRRSKSVVSKTVMTGNQEEVNFLENDSQIGKHNFRFENRHEKKMYFLLRVLQFLEE